MFALAIVLGSVGALLILVGLIGGDFTFSGSVIPKVGRFARVLSFTVGGLLVLSALFVVLLDPSISGPPSPTPASMTAQNSPSTSVLPSSSYPQSSGADTSSDAYTEMDKQVVSLLRTRPWFQGVPGADLVALSHSECGVLQRGGQGSDVKSILMHEGASPADASYGLAVAVAAYCPEYSSVAVQ